MFSSQNIFANKARKSLLTILKVWVEPDAFNQLLGQKYLEMEARAVDRVDCFVNTDIKAQIEKLRSIAGPDHKEHMTAMMAGVSTGVTLLVTNVVQDDSMTGAASRTSAVANKLAFDTFLAGFVSLVWGKMVATEAYKSLMNILDKAQEARLTGEEKLRAAIEGQEALERDCLSNAKVSGSGRREVCHACLTLISSLSCTLPKFPTFLSCGSSLCHAEKPRL